MGKNRDGWINSESCTFPVFDCGLRADNPVELWILYHMSVNDILDEKITRHYSYKRKRMLNAVKIIKKRILQFDEDKEKEWEGRKLKHIKQMEYDVNFGSDKSEDEI